LARSAIAPEISATVMIAKTAWKPTKPAAGCRVYAAAAGRGRRDQALRPKNSSGCRAGRPDVVAEGERVAVQHPDDADEAERAEAHHHHVEDALRADHAAVEEARPGVISSTSAALVRTQAVSPVSVERTSSFRVTTPHLCGLMAGGAGAAPAPLRGHLLRRRASGEEAHPRTSSHLCGLMTAVTSFMRRTTS
jgi:hypothetical protein